MTFTDAFLSTETNCNEILNTGSALYIQRLVCPNLEPNVVTFTVDAEALADAETLDLTHDSADTQYLRRGAILTFGLETAVVALDTEIPTGAAAVSVPVEALEATIVASATSESWVMQRLLSPINIPTNVEAQEENRTDLSSGLRGSMVKTKIEHNPQVSAFANISDRALYDIILEASLSDNEVYVLIVRSSGVHSFGRALISGWNDDGATESLSKPQFTIKYQGNWSVTKPYVYMTPEQQTAVNELRALSGLSQLS